MQRIGWSSSFCGVKMRSRKYIRAIVTLKKNEPKGWSKPALNQKTQICELKAPDAVSRFSAGYHPDVEIAWIEALQVRPESRGQGHGVRMVLAFEEWAAARGATEVRGEALAGSVEFWEGLGYEVAGHLNHRNRTPVRRLLNVPNPRLQEVDRETMAG